MPTFRRKVPELSKVTLRLLMCLGGKHPSHSRRHMRHGKKKFTIFEKFCSTHRRWKTARASRRKFFCKISLSMRLFKFSPPAFISFSWIVLKYYRISWPARGHHLHITDACPLPPKASTSFLTEYNLCILTPKRTTNPQKRMYPAHWAFWTINITCRIAYTVFLAFRRLFICLVFLKLWPYLPGTCRRCMSRNDGFRRIPQCSFSANLLRQNFPA